MTGSLPGVQAGLVLDPSLPVAGIPADEVIDALLAGIVRIKRRVEIYEADGVTPYDIPYWNARLVDGSVTVDRDRDERRMCDITLDNADGALVLDPHDGFWYDKILKVIWGINYFDAAGLPKSWETQVGEFMIDRIDEDYFPDLVKVTGRDYAKKCLISKIKNSVQFPQNTPIENMISSLAGNAGVTKIALPYTGQNYSRDIVFERGTERWNVMKQLADSIGHEVFFRADGFLTMKPYPDPVMSPLAWIFRTGKLDGTIVNYSRSSNDSRIRNHIVVVGATSTDLNGFTRTVFAEAINEDPASPTRVSRIGDRVEIIESDFITSDEQAVSQANQRLRIGALEEYSISFDSVMLPWLDASSIVDIIDDEASEYVPKRFLMNAFTLPLSLGPMSGSARRVTIVGTQEQLEYM